MQAYRFQVTPTVQNGQVSSWQLCYMNPPQATDAICGVGSATNPYPNVTVPEGDRNQAFQFKIMGDSDINFAPVATPTKNDPGPIWIHKKGDPNAPGVHGQINDIKGAKTKTLIFVDKNDNTDMLILKYQLNFKGPGDVMSSLDPDITNGGKGFFGYSHATALLIGTVVAIVLVSLWYSKVAAYRRAQKLQAGEAGQVGEPSDT